MRSEQGQTWQSLYEAHRPGEGLPCIPCDLSVEVRRVAPGAPLCDKNLLDSGLRKETGVTVVAIQRPNGELVTNPSWRHQLHAGDSVVILGDRKQLVLAAKFFQSPTAESS
ncbi:MAG: hypothetical protein K2Z81_06130 [Cyanobacteria bacterium]|nr:hypothetical protein [Cyanobacteriota bacterium]